jgi:dienelactone hydrolase
MSRVLLSAGFLTLGPASLAAQATQPYTFLMMLGRDTVVSEVVVKSPARVEVDMLDKLNAAHWHYALTTTTDGRVPTMTNAFYRVAQGDTLPFQSAELVFQGDSVRIAISGNVSRVQMLPAPPEALPYINPSSAMIEQLLRRARARGRQVDTLPLFALTGGRIIPAQITWTSGDSATITLGGAVLRAAFAQENGGRLLGLTTPGSRVVRLEGAHPLLLKKIDYGAPSDAPYSAEEVVVRTAQGLSLSGTLTLPNARSGKAPAVVTITGSGAEDRDERIVMVDGYRPFWQVADTLARRGIATLRLDDRGVNGSDAGPPNATSADYADDIRAALAYLRGRPEIDGSRLALVGHSEGGLIAPMIAGTDRALKGIVVMAGPAWSGRKLLEFQQRNLVDHAPSLTPEQRSAALAANAKDTEAAASTNAWLRFFMDYDPLPTARNVRVPVLILQGDTDQQVTPEQADALGAAVRSGGNRDVTVRRYPATNHLFLADPDGSPAKYGSLTSRAVRPEVLGALADWLVARLR